MITYHGKTEYYNSLADRPLAPVFGIGSCFVGSTEYLSNAATWTAAYVADTGAAALITGFTGVAGTVAATDSIVGAFNKVVGNIALRALDLLTGYVSGAGVVAATDTVLQAINKLNGNTALKANASAINVTYTTISSITITNGVVTAITGA